MRATLKLQLPQNVTVGCGFYHRRIMLKETSIFSETPFLGDCRPRLKYDSPAHETEYTCHTLHKGSSN